MRIWGWLIFALWFVSLAGICACAATESRSLGNGLFGPLLLIAVGQSFVAATIQAMRKNLPLQSWRRFPFFKPRVRVYTRQANPYWYRFGVVFFISIGFFVTAIGVWLLLDKLVT